VATARWRSRRLVAMEATTLRGTASARGFGSARTRSGATTHDMLVFGFAERAHTEQFQDRFGGEFVDPRDRKWPRFARADARSVPGTPIAQGQRGAARASNHLSKLGYQRKLYR
jgi:hypothetical protein